MLDAASALADREERVVRIRNLADYLHSRFHHALQIGRDFLVIDIGDIFEYHGVRNPAHLEAPGLLVAHQNRAIVEQIEIRSRKCVGMSCHRIESDGDVLPSGIWLDGQRDGMWNLPGDMQEYAGRRDVAAGIVQIAFSDKWSEGVHVVADCDGCGVVRLDTPRVLCGLRPFERMSRSVLRGEVHQILRVIHDAVEAGSPGRHLEILRVALEPVHAEDHVIVVRGRVFHG